MTDCHPLATTTVCVRPDSPYGTRRKDKSRSLRKPYSARCFSSPRPIPRPSVPYPPTHNSDDDIYNFPSTTPSEYAAYKATLNAASAKPFSTPLIHVPFRPIPSQTITPVVNIIPTLSLNLGLGRAVSSSHPSTPSQPQPHHHHPLSSNQTTSKRHRVSKTVIAEAMWWIKMYESLAWHIKRVEEEQQQQQRSSHELTFLERLEVQVRSRWYPIVQKARKMTTSRRNDDDFSGCRIISSKGLHSHSGSVEELGSALQPSKLYQEPTTVVLDPSQLAAQTFLRRSQASEKPMRRKRHNIPPKCSSLRCELTAQ